MTITLNLLKFQINTLQIDNNSLLLFKSWFFMGFFEKGGANDLSN